MNERVKAGLKAGGVWAICTIMLNLFFFYSIIVWIFCFIPGVLAVHFGRNNIRNIKDAVVSSLIAAIFSWFLSGIISSFLFSRYFFLFFLGIDLVIPIVMSSLGGITYAKYRLKISATGQKKPNLLRVSCPGCNRKIEPDWKVCPYCKTDLEPNICPYCGYGNYRVAARCQNCGVPFKDETRVY